MNLFICMTSTLARTSWLAALVLLAHAPRSQAQSFCASDGQSRPVQLMERFSATHAAKISVNADAARNCDSSIHGIFAIISASGRHSDAVAL